jgi:hypothetical protein
MFFELLGQSGNSRVIFVVIQYEINKQEMYIPKGMEIMSS